MPEMSRLGEKVIRGIPVSAGVTRGKVLLIEPRREELVKRTIAATELPSEMNRLETSLVQTRKQILDVQHRLSEALGAEEASIFEAHLLVLEDQVFMDQITRLMEKDLINVEYAVHKVAEEYINTLNSIDDEYLKERTKDMRDVVDRILGNLAGQPDRHAVPKLTEPCIIVCEDLTPSTTAGFDRKMVLGFATDKGSRTSHTAILARSLQIPAVVGLQNASRKLLNNQYILLDGFNGLLILNPTDQTLFEYGQLMRKQVDLQEKLRDLHDKAAVTLDGHQVTLSANVEKATDTAAVLNNGAEGVGLFRTEYLFLNREKAPDEEEQYQAYRQVAAALKPHPVIIRTLDLGGDKVSAITPLPTEMNPFLGWRAIRFCLQEKELFCQQLRAILRAAVEGNIKMMYPMICRVEELEETTVLLEECKNQLRAQNLEFNEHLEFGIMIETPSAALISHNLAKQVSFFSLGTNDLIQYTLAVDRSNERIAHLYEPTHPAVLNLIKTTVESAHRQGIWTGVCGEMASEIELVPLLVGLGVDELSVAPSLIPQVKFLIRRLRISEARALAEWALNCESGQKILERSAALARESAPSLFDTQQN
jgi:phosphotransferase system enzyme I (PtsI)